MPKLWKLSLSHNLSWKGSGAAALATHPALTSLAIGGSTFGDPGLPAIATIILIAILAHLSELRET